MEFSDELKQKDFSEGECVLIDLICHGIVRNSTHGMTEHFGGADCEYDVIEKIMDKYDLGFYDTDDRFYLAKNNQYQIFKNLERNNAQYQLFTNLESNIDNNVVYVYQIDLIENDKTMIGIDKITLSSDTGYDYVNSIVEYIDKFNTIHNKNYQIKLTHHIVKTIVEKNTNVKIYNN